MEEKRQPPTGTIDGAALAERLRTLARAQQRFGVTMARLLALAPSDVTALEHLLADGPLGPVELGQRLGMTSASATTLVDRLEAAGHVERRPHPSDRRRLVVVPTERAGETAYATGAPVFEGLEAAAADLTPEERGAVARYLNRAIAVLQSFGDPPKRR
jgi:DNA-binding MarR family transcriptional regulator